MVRLQYGKRNPRLVFNSESDFFEAYGFLCNAQKHGLEFQWEFNANSGAWGNEGRIHFLRVGFLDYSPKPVTFQNRLTAGRGGNIIFRLNCNDYITELVSNYGFNVNPRKPGNSITRSPQGLIPPTMPLQYVPSQYVADYNRGFNL